MISKYVVLIDRHNTDKYSAVKVHVKIDETPKEIVEVIFGGGKKQMMKKSWVYNTKEEAIRVCREREILKKIKNNSKINSDEWKCSSCGRHINKEELTVDHIRPISSFKENGKYISYYHWRKCWSEDNLTIMCVNCNENKAKMHIRKHLKLNKKSTYLKLKTIKKKRRKIQVKDNSFELAKRDSRILDINTILRKKNNIIPSKKSKEVKDMSDIKTTFLNTVECSDSVKEGFKMIFKKAEKLEKKFGKDLKDFNKEEILELLGELKGRSYNSVYTKLGIVRKYLNHFNNPYICEINSEHVRQNVVETDVRYVTREELRQKVEMLPCASHKALLFLLFDGVGGKGYNEICNLKFDDIDFEKRRVELEDRKVKLSKDTLELLEETKRETTVCKLLFNNDMPNLDSEYDVNLSSPYVFKTRITRDTSNGMQPYKQTGLQRRLDILTKVIGLDHVNGKSLYYSGLIEKYFKIEKKLGKKLSIEEIDLYSKKVGAVTIQTNTMYRAMNSLRK